MKVDKFNFQHWALLAKQAIFTWLVILYRLFIQRPKKPIVALYGHQFAGNLKALYETWETEFQSTFSFYFLTLDDDQATQLARRKVRALSCSRLRDMLVLAKASAVITDHGLHTMTPLLRFTNIKFIDVWHGIPFKGFIPKDFKLQHRYDEVWVASPFLRNLYVESFGFPSQKVQSLGYARTDKLFRRPIPASIFRKWAQMPEDQKLVLYAPTWRQDDAGRQLFPFGASQTEFTAVLASICQSTGARLVIRSHLNAHIDSDEKDSILYCSQRDYPDTEDLLLATDILICDWSSIAFDFLALERPTLFLDVPPPFKHGFSLGPRYRFGCIIENLRELKVKLYDYLQDPVRYDKAYAKRQGDTIKALYSSFASDRSARKQLERLAALVGTTANEN